MSDWLEYSTKIIFIGSLVVMVCRLSSSVDVGKEVVDGSKVNEDKLEILQVF